MRGGGTNAARRAIRSNGSSTMCVAIPVRSLELLANLARCGERQALAGHRRATHVAAQPLELLALVRRDVYARMQAEPARAGRSIRVAFQSLQPRRNRLQREQLLPSPWTYCKLRK